MSVAAFIFFFAGFFMEAVWLYHTGGSPRRSGWTRSFLYFEGSILVFAICLSGLAVVTHKAEMILPYQVILFSMLFLLIPVLLPNINRVSHVFLPRISEQTILVVQIITLISFFHSDIYLPTLNLLLYLIPPLLLTIWLVFSKANISPLGKLFLYLWYLLTLMVQAFICWDPLLKYTHFLSLEESFSFGVFYCFLVAHGQFLRCLHEIFDCFIQDRNREHAIKEIQTIFIDDQISALPFILFTAGASCVAYFLYHFQVPQAGLWANMLIILIVQVLFNPQIYWWFMRQFNQVD